MNYKQYEKMLNNIKSKAPIESGVQTLVFMLLHELFENSDYELVIIDNLRKSSRFATYSGVSDIAIVSNDFQYHGTEGKILFCIEVKSLDEKITQHDTQVLGHLLTYRRSIITNGTKWAYYNLDNTSDNDLEKLQKIVLEVVDRKREIAQLKSSLCHLKKDLADLFREKAEKIEELEKQNQKAEEVIVCSKQKFKSILTPVWELDLNTNHHKGIEIKVDKTTFIELIKDLCDVIQKL